MLQVAPTPPTVEKSSAVSPMLTETPAASWQPVATNTYAALPADNAQSQHPKSKQEKLLELQQVATLETLSDTNTNLTEVIHHLENAEVLQVLGASSEIPVVHALLTHLSHEKYGSNTIRNFTIAVIQSSSASAGEYNATPGNLPAMDAEHPNQGAFSHSIILARAFTTFVDRGELRA